MESGGIRRRIGQRLARLRSVLLLQLLFRAARDLVRHQGTVYAAATSYYALISLFPLLILLATIFGWVAHGTGLQQRIVDEVVQQFPTGTNLTKQVQNVLKGVDPQRGLIGLLSLLATMWTASGLFSVLRRALNLAFDVPVAHSYIHGRIYDFLSVFGVGFLALLSVLLTAALSLIRAFTSGLFRGEPLSLLWTVVFFLLPFAVSYAALVLLYRVIPNQRVEMRAILLGALAGAIAFELVKIGFTYYLAYFSSFEEVYGALGGVVSVLVFVYLESMIVLFCAEFASELAKELALRPRSLSRPAVAVRGKVKQPHG